MLYYTIILLFYVYIQVRKLLSDRAASDLDFSEVYTAPICLIMCISINVYRLCTVLNVLV